MDRRGGYGKRRGILPRPRPGQGTGTSPVSIRRREHAESSSGNDERETSEGLRESPPPTAEQAQQKPTIILMKPQRQKKNEEEEEEWPTVGKPVAIVSSRTGTPVRRVESAGATSAASSSVAEETSYDRSDWSSSTGRGFRRPLLANPSPATATHSAPLTASYQIQQKPPGSAADAGTKEIPGTAGARSLRAGIRLITEGMEWSETALDYLQDQTNFLVVGIIGPQGVGKSTLLSMIGGNDPFDMYRQYIFRPASKECTETGSRQTAGVQFYVNDNRILLLDSQPVMSHAIMEQMNQADRRYNYEYRRTENCMEVESLQIASFMMQVCHVVIFLVDWFVDVDLLRFLQTAEMLKPSAPISENPMGGDHFPHVVFVQNRARREDFTLLSIKSKCKFLDKMFEKSALHLKDGVSLKNSSYDTYEALGEECGSTNLFLLPDMKPRGYKPEALMTYKGIPDFEVLVRDLRNQIWSLPRSSFGPNVQTEKNWFHLAARTWDMTRKSLLISEYGRMLP